MQCVCHARESCALHHGAGPGAQDGACIRDRRELRHCVRCMAWSSFYMTRSLGICRPKRDVDRANQRLHATVYTETSAASSIYVAYEPPHVLAEATTLPSRQPSASTSRQQTRPTETTKTEAKDVSLPSISPPPKLPSSIQIPSMVRGHH